jgi:hypothetical protein
MDDEEDLDMLLAEVDAFEKTLTQEPETGR